LFLIDFSLIPEIESRFRKHSQAGSITTRQKRMQLEVLLNNGCRLSGHAVLGHACW
jgi:hypothetical protein